ncbi:neuropilin-1 [Exaiptasia diaphana]|uniref:F5/8 type C domain-containing protein n=1 Tax=Exaiptasia diaphana TaxID=2652724 RepID=A0A913XJ06_EXADI|nr:neuropilin-1 [Exaiptasia diaphana]
MENGKILDSQLSMSSYYNKDSRYGEKNGRLNKKDWPPGAQTDSADQSPWFKIDLLQIKYVSGVGIQGYHDGQSWTTSFMVSTSTDGSSWTMYQEIPGTNKVDKQQQIT